MSKNYKSKSKFKKILSIILVCASLIGTAALIIGITNRNKNEDGYKAEKLDYEIGALTDMGAYEESDKSLYTKEAFEVEGGVKVELDFDSKITYKVFFYDEKDKFVSASAELSETATTEVPEGATLARVMITPVWESDVDEDDQEIKWYNKSTYTKQLSVYVVELEEAKEPAT